MRTDIQQEVDRQMVRYIVQRNIFCPITGAVLDVRTCKWLVDADGDPAYVMSPEVFDAVVYGLNTEKGKAIVDALAEKGLFLP